MKKIYFLNKLNISLLFLIIFFFLANSINAQPYFNPSIGYDYSGYGKSFMPISSGYSGYPGYSYPVSSYSAYPYTYPYIGDGNYSRYVSLGGSLVPREIFELSASSNWDTAQLGQALIKPYFQSSVMSGWTPWGSSGGYPPISTISWAPPGMAYDPYNGSFYIPGQYQVGYSGSYYPNISPKSSNTASYSSYDETVIGRVVGSNSISVNGRIIRCWINGAVEASSRPLDLEQYMGMTVKVIGDFIGSDRSSLYGASFNRIVE